MEAFFFFPKPVGTDSIVDYYTKKEWEAKTYWCRMELIYFLRKTTLFWKKSKNKIKIKLSVLSKYIKLFTNRSSVCMGLLSLSLSLWDLSFAARCDHFMKGKLNCDNTHNSILKNVFWEFGKIDWCLFPVLHLAYYLCHLFYCRPFC